MSVEQEHRRRQSRLTALAMAGALIGCGAAAVVAGAGLSPNGSQAYADEPNGPQKAFEITDPRVKESSGLTFGTKHTDTLYTVNDSGNGPDIFALDSTGKVTGTITLGGANNTDWEAVAKGPDSRLWVGDIGDNDHNRESITLYRIHEPDQLTDQRTTWSRFTLTYSDGPHDAEALLVHPKTGRVYIVTKDPKGGAIYAGPEELASGTTGNTLTKVADAPPIVTDGAFLPDGSAAVVRTYGKVYVLNWPSGKVERTVGLPTQRQGESLAVSPDGKQLFAGSEGANSAVYKVSVNGPPPAANSPTSKKSATPKASPPASGAEAPGTGSKSTMKDLLGGLPWWIPALVLVAALIAGLSVFWPSRRRRGASKGARRPRDARAGDLDYADDERADRFRYDQSEMPNEAWQGDEHWQGEQRPWQDDRQPWQDDQPSHDRQPWQSDQPPPDRQPWESDSPPAAPWRDRPASGDLDWSSPPEPTPGGAGLPGTAAGAGMAGAGMAGAGAPDYGERPLFADEAPGYADTPRPYDEPPGPYDEPPRPYDQPPAPYDRPSAPYDQPSGPPFDEQPEPYDQPPRQPFDQPPAPYDQPGRRSFDEPPAFDPGRSFDEQAPPYDRPPAFDPRGSYDPSGPRDGVGRPYDEPASPFADGPPTFSDEPPPAFRRGGGERSESPGWDDTAWRDTLPSRSDPRDDPGLYPEPPRREPFDDPVGRDSGDRPVRQPPAWDPPAWDPEPAPTMPWRQPSGPPPQRGQWRSDPSEEPPGPPPPSERGVGEPSWSDEADVPRRRRGWQDEFDNPPRPRRLFRDDDPAD